MTDGEPVPGTQAIQRAFQILKEVGAAGPRGARVADLLVRLPIARPTLHRMLACLQGEGVLSRDTASKRFFLGRVAYELGQVALPRFDLRDICAAALQRIAARTGDTVFLVALHGDLGLVVDRQDGREAPRAMPLEIGMRRPLGVGASGLALLMAMPDEGVRRFAREHARQLRARDIRAETLPRSVAKFRTRGYAVSRGYGHPQLCGIGVPLPEGAGAISVTALSSRMTAAHRQVVLRALQEETASLGQLLCRGRETGTKMST